MAEAITVARPYAQAAFLFANAHAALKDWSEMLGLLAAIASDDSMRELIDSPQLTETQRADLFIDVAGERINEKCANFVRTLSANGRLQLLPEISALYNELRASAEGTIDASVVSAFPLEKAQVNKLAKMLKKELNRDVNIEATVDPSIIGGVIIRAGDRVIDSSVAGSLQNLTSYLTR